MPTKKQSKPSAKARSSSGRLVRLSSSDWRELKASGSRKGYATVRFNHRTGWMLKYQWKSWLKLAAQGLARIGPDGGEAEELCITTAGRAALKANKAICDPVKHEPE